MITILKCRPSGEDTDSGACSVQSRFLNFVLPTLMLLAASSVPLSAQSKDWTVELTPYVWLTGLGGEVATLPGFPPVEFNASFGDVLENLDGALMITGKVQVGRAGFLSDIVYAKLSLDRPTPGPFFSDAELETKNFIGTFTGVYRVVQSDKANLDLGAGLRVWNVETELLLVGAQIGPGQIADRRIVSSETWVDPVIISSLDIPLTRRVGLRAVADIGGFGASSDFTWQAYGGVSFRLSKSIHSVLGYRYLDVDYEKDGFLYDVAQQGFLLGISLRF